jgi:hypothetical protein
MDQPTQHVTRPGSPMDQPTQEFARPGPSRRPPPPEFTQPPYSQQPPYSDQPPQDFQQPPPSQPPEAGAPGPPPPPKPKRSWFRDPLSIILIVVIVLALIGAGLLGVEWWARSQGKERIAKAANCLTDDTSSVSFAMMPPFLWQYMNDHFDNITVITAGNQIKQVKGIKAAIVIEDVDLNGDANKKGTIGALNATITWTTDGIKQTLNETLPDKIKEYVKEHKNDFDIPFVDVEKMVDNLDLSEVVSSVKTDPSANTVTVEGKFNISITVRPDVDNADGSLRLVIPPDGFKIAVPILGDFTLPSEALQSKLDEKTKGITDNKLHIRLSGDKPIEVTDNAVVGHLSTKNADIPKSDTTPDEYPYKCFKGL